MTEASSSSVHVWREQSLTATVHKACTQCQAPGKFFSTEAVQKGWPGCYVEPGDQREDSPVGTTCPNCGAARSPSLIKQLGEIWRKRFT